jgi:hypothetical protein
LHSIAAATCLEQVAQALLPVTYLMQGQCL